MHIFYTPDIDPEASAYTLSEEESKHCIRVMRLKVGDTVVLVDGKGGSFRAEIIDAHPKRTSLSICSFNEQRRRSSYRIHVAVAPTKNIERYEWFLEKATEIGVDEITPIICEHSERKDVKSDRLVRVLIAAMKQSKQSFLPKLNDTRKIGDFLKTETDAKCFIAHCDAGEKAYLNEQVKPGEDVTILIGPEGDFSTEEIGMALSLGCQPISLGVARLRTETAGVVACLETAIINR